MSCPHFVRTGEGRANVSGVTAPPQQAALVRVPRASRPARAGWRGTK
jgi:hypothetical protein